MKLVWTAAAFAVAALVVGPAALTSVLRGSPDAGADAGLEHGSGTPDKSDLHVEPTEPDPFSVSADPGETCPDHADPGPSADRRQTPMWFNGVAMQMQTGFGPVEGYVPLIREISALGADTVLLSTAALMEHARAQAIFIDSRKTPSPQDFVTIIREAKKMGLKVVIMPILLLTHPHGSEWRGVIDPPNWEDWWRQYREFLVHFANIAREGGADAMIVGSELVSTEKYTAEWVKTIETARQYFPGKLGYSANWDHYKPIQFWDKLDFVGMTSYYRLADRSGATVEEMIAKWEPIQLEILAWQRKVGKPIVMTEVGWCSQVGAAVAPWNYYQSQQAKPEGHEEQKRLYEAFIRVWEGVPELAGVIWWEWTASPGGPADFGYTPKNKPAEQVLRQWFKNSKEPPAAEAPNPNVSPPAGS